MFLTGRGTLASCPRQEETRDKRVPVAAAGSGPLAGKLAPEYPEWSGCQSQRRRVSPELPFCRKADPFQGPKLGSCLTLRNEFFKETYVLTKQEISGLERSSKRRNWQPTPVFLPGKSYGWRSLVGYSPWGHKELDMTERLSTRKWIN